MKIILYLLILLSFCFQTIAQDKIERFSLNFGLNHPVIGYPSHYKHKYIVNPEMEVLINFPVFKSSKLYFGAGLQYGEYNKLEDVSYLAWVEELGLWPYENTYHWNLSFTDLYLPVKLETPLKNYFFDSYLLGVDYGWFLKYNLSEHQMPDVSHLKINRHFLDWNFGLKKDVLKNKTLTVSGSSIIGFRTYLTDENSWQKNYFFYKLQININLKKYCA